MITGTTVKALTLWQPWATLVAIGAKTYETRSWSTDYHGPLAIHAAGSRVALDLCFKEPFCSILAAAGYETPSSLPLGQVLAICHVDGSSLITPIGLQQAHLSEQELAFGDYTPGRFSWLLGYVRRLPTPITATGRQRIWTWDFSIWNDAVQRMIVEAGGGR